MSSEQNFWNTLRGHLEPFGKLQRVENKSFTGVGTPDVAYCLRRKPKLAAVSGWIELKEAEWPARRITALDLGITLDQVIFLEEWTKAGGQAWIMAQVSRDYLIWPAEYACNLHHRQWTKLGAQRNAFLVWTQGSPWPLARILDILTGT